MLYWFVFNKSLKWQNALLLFSSYVFYGWWDWRFLFLLVFSTGLDFYTGLKIHDSKSIASKKTWLWISIGINLGFLGFLDTIISLLKAGLLHLIELDIIWIHGH
jgi:D-alanyl-lipoteichoic acid acyltransferase DltB (MBOAT superfamily)